MNRSELSDLPVNLVSEVRALENGRIDQALAQTLGNVKEAALLLGLGRTTLVEKIRRRNARNAGLPVYATNNETRRR